MKATFEYDTASGMITDSLGLAVYIMGMTPFEQEDTKQASSVDDMIKLKNAGFTAEDIIAIKKASI